MRKAYPSMSYHIPSQVRQTIPSPQMGKQMSLLVLQEERQLPTRHAPVGTRMSKIMRIEQSAVLPDAMTLPRSPLRGPGSGSEQLAAAPRPTLPPPQLEPPELEGWLDGQRVHLRSVGEAMTDKAGNFYEVHGQHLRPLVEVVSDEQGRIIEVQPSRQAQPAATEQPGASSNEAEQSGLAFTTNNGHRVEPTSRPARSRETQPEPSPAYRTILSDPGLYLQLPWARVKSDLAPQLSKSTREPFETYATSRQIYAGQRVYRLWPVFDPTIERDNTSGRLSVAAAEKAATLRTQIPQQYLNPLQFRASREEVLYDMQGVLGTLPPQATALTRWIFIYPLRLLKVFLSVLASNRQLKKWRVMLGGKSLDQQLWTVTPLRGFAYHPAVRRWAAETLTEAGYDPAHMLAEWEVFWRRKGRWLQRVSAASACA